MFDKVFGELDAATRSRLYSYLLLQAYHGGLGRVLALLEAPEFNRPAQYFAQHHQRFSAGDILLGMIFHNLGKNELGFASLYYVTDSIIAAHALCNHPKAAALAPCQ